MNIEELRDELLAARRSLNRILTAIEDNPSFTEGLEFPKEDENLEFMDSIIDLWNIGLKSKCTLNETVKRQFRARLKSYSKDQVLYAIQRRIDSVNDSSFHNDPANRHHKVNISLVLRNDQDLGKYLESYSQQELFEIKEVTIGKKEESNPNMLD